jgi:hypothetical protein
MSTTLVDIGVGVLSMNVRPLGWSSFSDAQGRWSLVCSSLVSMKTILRDILQGLNLGYFFRVISLNRGAKSYVYGFEKSNR